MCLLEAIDALVVERRHAAILLRTEALEDGDARMHDELAAARRDERLDEVDGRNKRQNLKLIYVRAAGVAVTQTIFGVGVAGVIYMAGLESADGNLTAGQFISFFGAMMLMLQPVRRITNVNATLQRGVAAADSLFTVMDEDDEIDTGTIGAGRLKGDVEFRDVRFAYGDNKSAVLQGISIELKAGKSLAVVGHSGSGKTTLASLLPRFYNVDAGEIRLDGVPIHGAHLRGIDQRPHPVPHASNAFRSRSARSRPTSTERATAARPTATRWAAGTVSSTSGSER